MLIIVSILCFSSTSSAQTPVSHPEETWGINDVLTDEFNGPQIDQAKWDNNVGDWGTWSWEPENAYITDTALTLRMIQDQHMRGGKEYYFKSGINRSRTKVTYGYFETRIKASDKGQGTAPAFWLYSKGEPTPTEEGGVKYCEIDAIEIFQVPNQLQRLEMNLHTRIIENGVLTWIRPGQGDLELTHNTWVAPWDPRNDYHTYGTLNRLDSIFWYVDGIQRGAKKNYYWHLPMYVTASMGLRTPYEQYVNGVRIAVPHPESEPEPGFPTEMYCDYIRAWKTDAQIYADYEKYYNAEFNIEDNLKIDVRYFAGTNESVLEESWNGVTCALLEVTEDNEVVNEIVLENSASVGKENGIAKFIFQVSGLTPSNQLATGNKYILQPVFRTSMNGGEDIYLTGEFYPITLVETSSVNNHEALEKVKITSPGDNVAIEILNGVGNSQIRIFNLSGSVIYSSVMAQNTIIIDKSKLDATGIFVVSVEVDGIQRVEKVALFNN